MKPGRCFIQLYLLVHVEISSGTLDLLIDNVIGTLKILVDFQVKQFFSVVVRVNKKILKLRNVNQDGQLVQKGRNH